MPRSHDAIIIGSGVIGCSIATELARRGHRTLNLDKLSLAGSGSTSYSSGICRMMYSVADSVKFAWEGYTYYDRWAEHIGTQPEGGLAQFRRCGGLVLRSEASETFLGRVMAAHDSVGLPYEEWSREELRRRGLDDRSFFPPRRIDDEQFGDAGAPLDGAVFFPKCGYVSSPDLAARNLQSAAMATGLSEFRFGAPVSAILRKGGAVSGVAMADGTTLEAPVVINAAGPHSSSITALAFPDAHDNDMALTTRPMRQEVAYAPPPPEVDWCTGTEADMIVTDLDTGVYMRPEGAHGEKLLIGSIEPECDEPYHRYPRDPESVYPGREDAALTEQWTNQIYRAALRVPTLPVPTASATQGLAACYDVTADWTPIYDKSALPGYFMAIGTSGNQFKNAGVAGRLMADIIEATQNGADLDAAPLDFKLLRIPGQLSISSATFSRRRQHLATSGTVLG